MEAAFLYNETFRAPFGRKKWCLLLPRFFRWMEQVPNLSQHFSHDFSLSLFFFFESLVVVVLHWTIHLTISIAITLRSFGCLGSKKRSELYFVSYSSMNMFSTSFSLHCCSLSSLHDDDVLFTFASLVSPCLQRCVSHTSLLCTRSWSFKLI